MDSPEVLDVSKENIQPLRQGRNASQLSAALQAQTDATILQNLVRKRQEYELLLRTYDGDDPLSIWFEYIEWVEQSFPKDGKEGNLMTLLQNCLTRFKESVEYFQDIRLVKLWIKYLDKLENPLELYSQLHCHGIGSQCALFYRCWAYELCENEDFKQANKVLLTGIGRNAQPIDELMRTHEKFQIAVARRVMDKSLPASEEKTVGEERKVGNVLKTFGRKHKVPSVRIGGRVKSSFPGTLHSKENLVHQRNVDPVNIYEAENDPEMARSVNKMQTVPHLEILRKENCKMPTPWSGVKQKSAYQFHPPKPSFQVLSDENAQPEPLNTVMFLNALKPKKEDDGFICPIAIFEVPNPSRKPMYPKDQIYAGGEEYSLEELKAVKYMKREEKRNRELLAPDTQDAAQMEITQCAPSHSAELENLSPLMACASENISVSTSKKESNSCTYTESVFHHKQQLSESDSNYEKCTQAEVSSAIGSNCFLGDKKLPERPSVPNSQYRHCVEGSKYTDPTSNHLAEMDSFGSRSVLTPLVGQCVVDGSCVPESADTCHSENANTILSSTKRSFCTPALLLAENEQQKLNNQGIFPVNGSGLAVLTTGDSSAETVKADVFCTSLTKEEMPHPKNGDPVSSSNKPSSGMPSLLVAEDEQQKLMSQDKFSLTSGGFSVFSTGANIGAPETVKTGGYFTSLQKEDMPCSENTDTMLSSPKQSSSTSPSPLPENEQQKVKNQGTFPVKGSGFSVYMRRGGVAAPETVKAGGFFNSLNKEEILRSENAEIILPSNKSSSCMPTMVVAENDQQNQMSQGKSLLKSSGFSVFTTDEDVSTPETVKAGGYFSSFNKEEIPYSENAGIMLSIMPSPFTSSFLIGGNEQQKRKNQGALSVKSDFSVLTAAEGTGASETVKTGNIVTHSKTEEIVSHSDHKNVLLSNKVEGLSSPVLMEGNENKKYEELQEEKISVNGNRIPEFPIFNDEENCHAEGQVGLVKAEQENGFFAFPSKSKNLFSHSVLCGSNKLLNEDGRFFSSTTKKNKVAPFQLFIDDGEVAEGPEPCATKRELFKDANHQPSDKLCEIDLKENMALLSMYTQSNRPITEKREIKVCDNIVTASMIKLRQKKATEQIKGPAAEECEQVTPATAVPKKSEGCVPSSISASSEEVLKVINECWASPPKIKRDAENLCPELPKQPNERDFEHSSPLNLPAALTRESGFFPDNKENALPQCTKQKENILEPANTSVSDEWFGGQLGEPRALDDTCCTLMFSKTLISSTPNRKSVGPLSSDSSDTSPPDSQEFKIPRRCTPVQAERFAIMPRPDALSVIMESSKENKSQSSSGSSCGGRTTQHTAFSLVSPQMENKLSALEMQPPCETHAVITTRSLLLPPPPPPHDEGDSSI